MGIIFKNIELFCLKIFFTFTNSVDPDEMHLGLHCLQKYSYIYGFPEYIGLIYA